MKNLEESFGVVPLRREAGLWRLLMVRHLEGHWGFPKGHLGEGESPRQGAERELFEEVGLRIAQYHLSPPLVEEYTYVRKGHRRHKRVTYWLAEVVGEAVVQAEELTEARWIDMVGAIELATFTEGKRLCRAVKSILEE